MLESSQPVQLLPTVNCHCDTRTDTHIDRRQQWVYSHYHAHGFKLTFPLSLWPLPLPNRSLLSTLATHCDQTPDQSCTNRPGSLPYDPPSPLPSWTTVHITQIFSPGMARGVAEAVNLCPGKCNNNNVRVSLCCMTWYVHSYQVHICTVFCRLVEGVSMYEWFATAVVLEGTTSTNLQTLYYNYTIL